MAITRDEIQHVAKLARIALSDDEIRELSPQFDDILEFLGRVKSLPTLGEADVVSTENEGEYREDNAQPFEDPDAIVSQFPKKDGRYARVPSNL